MQCRQLDIGLRDRRDGAPGNASCVSRSPPPRRCSRSCAGSAGRPRPLCEATDARTRQPRGARRGPVRRIPRQLRRLLCRDADHVLQPERRTRSARDPREHTSNDLSSVTGFTVHGHRQPGDREPAARGPRPPGHWARHLRRSRRSPLLRRWTQAQRASAGRGNLLRHSRLTADLSRRRPGPCCSERPRGFLTPARRSASSRRRRLLPLLEATGARPRPSAPARHAPCAQRLSRGRQKSLA